MLKTYDIYFSDLNDRAQTELMNTVGISDPAEMNWDIDVLPLVTYMFEDELEE